MLAKAHDYELGSIGIYGVPEAARILAVTPTLVNGHALPPSRLRYWIRASVETHNVALPSERRFISFRALISMRMVAVLSSHGMRLQEIRDTETWVRDHLGLDWPFVSRPLWTFRNSAYMKFGEYLVAVSRFGQRAMDFLEDWLSEVDIDMVFSQDGLVSSWTPYTDISLNPKIQIGRPCVSGTRIPTTTVRGKLLAGDSIKLVARLYDPTREQIVHAVEWEERLAAA